MKKGQLGEAAEPRACAVGYHQKVGSFEFYFLLNVYSAVLSVFGILFSIVT